ncbi:MAG: hypothetical protein QM779_00515 [Propionicimonas sp.]|uniref:hypothetical protein n=1 Tax=Propionicimonas sp. TaxID=1955623 RepID=UPI003D0F6A7E
MDLGYLGIGLVLVIGVAVVVHGWLSDRTDTSHRQDALTGAPDRDIPGLRADAPAPDYLTGYEALERVPYHPSASLTDAERAALQARLPGSPSLPVGHTSSEFVTDEASGLCVLPSPWILVADHDVTTIRELLPLLEKARAGDRSVVVVAPALSGDVIDTLRVNVVKQTLRSAAVLIPDAAQRRALCSLVGALPVPWEDLRAGYVPESSLGTCDTWVSSSAQSWMLSDAS